MKRIDELAGPFQTPCSYVCIFDGGSSLHSTFSTSVREKGATHFLSSFEVQPFFAFLGRCPKMGGQKKSEFRPPPHLGFRNNSFKPFPPPHSSPSPSSPYSWQPKSGKGRKKKNCLISSQEKGRNCYWKCKNWDFLRKILLEASHTSKRWHRTCEDDLPPNPSAPVRLILSWIKMKSGLTFWQFLLAWDQAVLFSCCGGRGADCW